MKIKRPQMSGSEKFTSLVQQCQGTFGPVTRLRRNVAAEIAKAESHAVRLEDQASTVGLQVEAEAGLLETLEAKFAKSGTTEDEHERSASRRRLASLKHDVGRLLQAAGDWRNHSEGLRTDLNTMLEEVQAEASLAPL